MNVDGGEIEVDVHQVQECLELFIPNVSLAVSLSGVCNEDNAESVKKIIVQELHDFLLSPNYSNLRARIVIEGLSKAYIMARISLEVVEKVRNPRPYRLLGGG